jgi:hypothetical protein
MYSSILCSTSALGASLWLLLAALPGCGDDNSDMPGTSTNVNNVSTPPVFTPPPVLEEGQDGYGPEPTALTNRWGACNTTAQCLPNEQCIRGITESFNVCLSPCTSVDDCTDPSIPLHANFTAFMTCTDFLGAKRCILGCQTTVQCIAGMTCITGACVWR